MGAGRVAQSLSRPFWDLKYRHETSIVSQQPGGRSPSFSTAPFKCGYRALHVSGSGAGEHSVVRGGPDDAGGGRGHDVYGGQVSPWDGPVVEVPLILMRAQVRLVIESTR